MQRHVTIVGAGLVGSLLAILLARRGYKVDVYERRPDPRSGKVVGGRSINLALSDRGLLALEKAGVAAEIEKVAIPMKGRMMHAKDGALAFQPYGTATQAIRSVSRGGLNTKLLELVHDEKNARVHFEKRCTGFGDGRVSFDGGESVEHDLLVGADGAFSAIRYEMQKQDRFDYAQEYLAHGYKELNIPPAQGATLEKNALHIWPRTSFMLIALPNTDGSFTCTLFFPMDGEPSFAALDTAAKARAFFSETFGDALALMPTFDDDWQKNPTSSLCTIRCRPWSSAKTRTLLVGDAAHAIVPFFGQGMNAGFEDCRVLMQILDDTKDDWDNALPRFEAARKENADAIALLALENFVEMRDKTGQPAFLLRKKIEARLGTLCPERFVPLYTLVTFSPHVPYAEALERGRAQDHVLDTICSLPNIEATWDKRDDELRHIVAAMLPV